MAKRPAPPAPVTSAAPATKGLKVDALKKIGTPVKTPKTSARPVWKLTEKDTATAVELIEMKTIFKIVETQLNNTAELFKAVCYDEWLKLFWKGKAVPVNPLIQTTKPSGKVDHSIQFAVVTKLKVDLPDATDEKSSEDLLLEALTGGKGDDRLDEKKAIELIKTEMDMGTLFVARSLNDLLIGHYEKVGTKNVWIDATELEQAAGEKLQAFLLARVLSSHPMVEVEGFTEEEADIALRSIPVRKVRSPKDYLARVCGYCRTEAELRRVFSVIKPELQTSHAEFAVSDAVDEKHSRLSEAARRVIGMDSGSSDDDD